MAEKSFTLRSFTSFVTFFSFISLGLTGIVLYIVPQGRVAYWVHWQFLGLSKDSWAQVHTLSALLFLIAAIIHTILNWKPLWGYVFSKTRRALNRKWELAAGFLLTLVFVLSAIFLWPPLSAVIDLGQAAKDTWVVEDAYDPPFGHAEETSLKTFCSRMNIDLQKATEALRAAGIQFDGPRQTLEQIAVANGTTPMALYAIFKQHEQVFEPADKVAFTEEEIERNFTGVGFGRETLSGTAERLKIDLDLVKQRLAAHGIELADDETLKAAADRLDSEVIQLIKYILIVNYQPAPAN